MRTYRIDPDLGVSIQDEAADWMTDEIIWSTLPYDKRNSIFFDDEAMASPGFVVARIGPHEKVPLPAYLVGVEGENRVDTDIDIDLLEVSLT